MSIDLSRADQHLLPQLRAAEEAGVLLEPHGEQLSCPCGYSGPPLCILANSEWEMSMTDHDLFVCPECGDA